MTTRTALQTLRDRAQAEHAAQNPRGMTELDEMLAELASRQYVHGDLITVLRHIADRLPVYPRTGTVGPQVVSLPGESAEEHKRRQDIRDTEARHWSEWQEEKARRSLDPETPLNAVLGALSPDGATVADRCPRPPAEDRTKPPQGWRLQEHGPESKPVWWIYPPSNHRRDFKPAAFLHRVEAIAACWAEVDRERAKSIADTSERPRDLSEAADERPYFVELENAKSGCEHCGSGRIWGVIQPDGFMRGQMFGDEEDAIDLAEAMNDAHESALSGEAERTRKAVDAAIAEDRAMVQRSNEDPVLDAQFRSALAQRVWLAGKAATAVELAFAICPDQAGGHEMVLALIDHARRIGASEERERLAKMFDDEHRCNTAAHIRDSKP